jgi:hypothetical protein
MKGSLHHSTTPTNKLHDSDAACKAEESFLYAIYGLRKSMNNSSFIQLFKIIM